MMDYFYLPQAVINKFLFHQKGWRLEEPLHYLNSLAFPHNIKELLRNRYLWGGHHFRFLILWGGVIISGFQFLLPTI